MEKKELKGYTAPQMEIYEVAVDKGFAVSGDPNGWGYGDGFEN